MPPSAWTGWGSLGWTVDHLWEDQDGEWTALRDGAESEHEQQSGGPMTSDPMSSHACPVGRRPAGHGGHAPSCARAARALGMARCTCIRRGDVGRGRPRRLVVVGAARRAPNEQQGGARGEGGEGEGGGCGGSLICK